MTVNIDGKKFLDEYLDNRDTDIRVSAGVN